MLQIPRAVGGTVRWRAPARPDAAPTVQVLDAGGGERVAAATAATLHTCATTTSAVAAAGATVVSVTSANNVTPGEEYLIGSLDRPTDFVKVQSVSGTDLTLQHPLLYAVANGATFTATYIDYTITAAVANEAYEDWQARFTWLDGTVAQPEGVVRFDVVRYAPARTIPLITASPFFTLNDLRMLEPKVTLKLADTFDYEWTFAQSMNDACRHINASLKAGGIVQDDDFRWLGAYQFLAEYAGPLLGERYERTQKQWKDRYISKLDTLKSQLTVDANQNLAISDHEHGTLGGLTYRS